MPVIVFHMTRESTEYTVLTHIRVWVKTKVNIAYPDANLTSIKSNMFSNSEFLMIWLYSKGNYVISSVLSALTNFTEETHLTLQKLVLLSHIPFHLILILRSQNQIHGELLLSQNYVTSEGAVSHNVFILHVQTYQQLSIARYQVSLHANNYFE